MIGASFQPGVDNERDRGQGQTNRPPGASQGVQEAIKVLSLRLPKVVGAQAVSPQALLTSQGARGNPRVDSIVESVLQQMFPSGAAPSGEVPSAAPSYQPQVEQFRSQLQQPGMGQRVAGRSVVDSAPSLPNIIVGTPPPGTPAPPSGMPPQGNPRSGTDADLSQGGGTPPGMIAPLPDLRRLFDWLPSGPPESTPLI